MQCSFRVVTATIAPGIPTNNRPARLPNGITGAVACGKSTLGRVFLCEAPYGGSVRFGGRELSSLTPRQIAATVGYLAPRSGAQRRYRLQ